MAAGRAEKAARELGGPVRIVDRHFATRWHPVWDGNPAITTDERRPSIQDGPGCRPYIATFTSELQTFTSHRARDHRGHLYLADAEKAAGQAVRAAGRYLLIEPHTKEGANPNKRWPWVRWVELAGLLSAWRLVQVGVPGTKMLPGAEFVPTAHFREAAGVLASAEALVASEGGLHHAAAALARPAVVIFGGALSVQATGYPEHINLGGDEPCGRWVPCGHCRRVMDDITPSVVSDAVEKLFR